MEKVISLTVHTERLHSDSLWQRIEGILRFFEKHNIGATWFSINPTFVGYRAMGFDEEKWIERLKFLKESGQEIQQHTHFYKGKEGIKKGLGYDLGKENVRLRLLEDKKWLREKIEIVPEGFISGAWKKSKEIILALKEENYKYNLVSERENFQSLNSFLEIPNSNLKSLVSDLFCFNLEKKFIKQRDFSFYTFYFHDYDLERFSFCIFLKTLILSLLFLKFKFVFAGKLYKRLTKVNDYH